jgi:FkbM family methyltransferase
MTAVYRKLYLMLRPKDVVLVSVQGNKMYVKPDDSGISLALINVGIWERHATEVFYSLVKPGMTILDIGANMGYYTLIASRLVGETGHVYAFEAAPDNYELIVRNIRINGYRNVTVFNSAVSDAPGRSKLYLESSNWGHSLASKNINDPAGSIDVDQVALDDLFTAGALGRQINLIKMDVQGAEGLVVKGAGKVLRQHRPTIMMELEPLRLRNLGSDSLELLRWFDKEGYGVEVIEKDVALPSSPSLEGITLAAEKVGVLNVLLAPKGVRNQ